MECKQINTKSKNRTTGSRIGRPSKEESKRRHEELLECALDIFLDRGYEQTTMVEVATVAGMSKRTVYAHYKDKEELFKAAVSKAIDRYTIPLERLQAVETDNLEETLQAVARLRIANVSTPTGIKLQRVLNGQSFQFPGLFNQLFEMGTRPTIEFLTELFNRANDRGETAMPDPQRAAIAFLSLVVSGPARFITSGQSMPQAEIESRIKFSVDLFLNGVRPR